MLTEAIRAIEKYPFYRWLYTEKYDISSADMLPTFSKKEIFEYEHIHSKPYHEKASSHDCFLRTTGTEGRMLEVPFNHKIDDKFKCENLFTYMDSLLLYPVRSVGFLGNYPKEIHAILNQLFESCAIYHLRIGGDLAFQLEHNNITVVADSTLEISKQILINPDAFRSTPLKIILYVTMDSEMKDRLESLGLIVISLYISVDSGFIGFSNGGPFKLKNSDFSVLVNGAIAKSGTGDLITANLHASFPLIQYRNGDQVTIKNECSYCELILLGRKFTVYIPNEYEAKIDYRNLYHFLLKKADISDVFFVLYRHGIHHDNQNILATFVETNSSNLTEYELQNEIMNTSVGSIVDEYRFFLPVFLCPPKTINKLGRNKEIINLTEGANAPRWEDFLTLSTLMTERGYIVK